MEASQLQSPSSPTRGQQTGQEPALTALAPNTPLLTEMDRQAEDSACPVLLHIDELLSLEKISAAKAVQLKSSYKTLLETIRRSQESEVRLLEEASRGGAELSRLQALRARLEAQGEAGEDDQVEEVQGEEAQGEEAQGEELPSVESSRLRQELLEVQSELRAAQEREVHMQHTLQCQQEQLSSEEEECLCDVTEKEDRLKARHAELMRDVEEIRKQISGAANQLLSLQQQVETEGAELEEVRQAASIQLISDLSLCQLTNQNQRLEDRNSRAQQEVQLLQEEVSRGRLEEEEVRRGQHLLQQQQEVLQRRQQEVQGQREAQQEQQHLLLQEKEQQEKALLLLLGDKGVLDMRLREVEADRKFLCDTAAAQSRDNSRLEAQLRRLEEQLEQSSRRLEQTQYQCSRIRAKRDSLPAVAPELQRVEQLQMEVKHLKTRLEQQYLQQARGGSEETQVSVLLQEVQRWKERQQHLLSVTSIRRREKENTHQQLLKTKMLQQQLQCELTDRQTVLLDKKKQYHMLQQRLAKHANVCVLLKSDLTSLEQLSQRASSDEQRLRDTLTLRENQLSTLRTTHTHTSRKLDAVGVKLTKALGVKKHIQNDIAKLNRRVRQLQEECETARAQADTQTYTIDRREKLLLETNLRLETAVQRRIDISLLVLQGEQGDAWLQERVRQQERLLQELRRHEEEQQEELQLLQVQEKEDRRQLEVVRRSLVQRPLLEGERQHTYTQLEAERHSQCVLEEEQLQIGPQQGVYRVLAGPDHHSDNLLGRAIHLEEACEQKELRLKEVELSLDQVTRLCQPIKQQLENSRLERLTVVKQLMQQRKGVWSTDNRIKGMTAQLSVYQAAAVAMETEKQHTHHLVALWQQCVQQGAICPELEEEERRHLQRERQRERVCEEDPRVTVERRFDSYIPDDGGLPIPRPYGAWAPFCPTQPGAAMRHIRKPQPPTMEPHDEY